jgi:hypothetical protein
VSNSLNFVIKKKQIESINTENDRLMKKIMNIESGLKKSAMDDNYEKMKSYKHILSKNGKHGYEIGKIVGQQKRTYAHVESKTS